MTVGKLMVVVVADVAVLRWEKGQWHEVYRGNVDDIPEWLHEHRVSAIGCVNDVMEVVLR